MDIDRPHHRCNSNSNSTSNTTSSELFVCFTSRLSSSSSSSMKISSKSILSPGRCSREPTSQISLSNSLSRRLRSNGSMKGGQASPMFPSSNGKKRGCSFENPEPSSPKVTCIGQVRVKTKKQGRKMRQRRAQSGEVSFRNVKNVDSSSSVVNDSNNNNNNVETSTTHQDFRGVNSDLQQQDSLSHRNQRWVHLPLSICEALRAFGAEFNCFLPCRPSCMASEKDKQEKAACSSAGNGSAATGSSQGSSCAAVFARWLVAVQEGDDGKGREIELVVGEEEEVEEEDFTERRRSYRRHVFEEIEFNEEKFGVGNDEVIEDDEAARVSICIPPKNALLLMRCRSDPVKMAALANKFWEPPPPPVANIDDDEEKEDEDESKVRFVNDVKEEEKVIDDNNNNNNNNESNVEVEVIGRMKEVGQEMEKRENLMEEKLVCCQYHEAEVILEEEEEGQETPTTDIDCVVEEEASLVEEEEKTKETPVATASACHSSHDEASQEDPEEEKLKVEENNEENSSTMLLIQQNENATGDVDNIMNSVHEDSEENQESKLVAEEEVSIQESNKQEEEEEDKTACIQEQAQQGQEETVTAHEGSGPGDPRTREEEETGVKSKERESQQPLLPDCLLLMMCEPKLSMEVSKETWVCSTDFIRWLPDHSRPQGKKKDGGDQPKKRNSIDSNNPPLHPNSHQPPRSSCSYPAKPPPRAAGAESMTTAIEKKLVGTKAYEPFVLTRCKSEPMRSAAKLAPDACFWKNRKIEPHRPATLGVGAATAGVGF